MGTCSLWLLFVFLNHPGALFKGWPWGQLLTLPRVGAGGRGLGSATWGARGDGGPLGVFLARPAPGVRCGREPLPHRYPLYQLGNPQLRVFRTNFFIQLVRPGSAQPDDTVQFRIPME